MYSWATYRFMILIKQLNLDLDQTCGISEEDRAAIQEKIDELSQIVLGTLK